MQLRSALRSAEESYENTLLTLVAALDLRDGQTADHSRRVCDYALEIATRMGCSELQLKSLGQGALLHDIGKLSIPDAIEEIALKSGHEFDPSVVQAFLDISTTVLAQIHARRGQAKCGLQAVSFTASEFFY